MLLVGYPIFLLSFLTPRQKKKWVFGSDNGFGCNAKYLFIHTLEHEASNLTPIWVSRSRETAVAMRKLGYMQSYYYLSIQGLYHLFTAGRYITTHDLHRSLSLWTKGRAKWVNLWHGVGIKALRF